MAKEKKNVVDAEIVSAPKDQAEKPAVRTELIVGIDETGSVYYKIAGPDQSLITIEGLLHYARVEMDRLWGRTLQRTQ